MGKEYRDEKRKERKKLDQGKNKEVIGKGKERRGGEGREKKRVERVINERFGNRKGRERGEK